MTKSYPTKAEARAALRSMESITLITMCLGLWGGLWGVSTLLTAWSVSGLLAVPLAIAISLTFAFGLILRARESWVVLQEYIKTSNPTGLEKSTDFGGEELSSNAM